MSDEERNKTTVKVTDISPLPEKAPSGDTDLLILARKQAKRGLEAVKDDHDKGIADLEFAFAEDFEERLLTGERTISWRMWWGPYVRAGIAVNSGQ